MMKKILSLFAIFILGCTDNQTEQVVNIYSQRHYDIDQMQYDNFEKLTGIKVNVIKSNADELIQRIQNEGDNSPADLFITVDVGKLWQASNMGLLQKYQDESLTDGITESLLDKNGFWIPVTYRSRILVHSNERVQKGELSTYEDLANDKWKGRLLVRSSSNSYNQALLSSLVGNLGDEATKSWTQAVVSNFARDPKGNDRDQVKAIAAGQGDVAIVNSYYIGLLLSSENEDLRARLGLNSASNGLSLRIPSVGQGKPTPVLASPTNKPLVQPPRQTGPTQMETYVVQSGDSLYAISRKFYGDSSRIDLIFEANRNVMRSKNSLSVGQKLRIPPVPLNR